MATIEELKEKTQASIEARSAWLIDVAKTILAHPEPGFQEVTTARLVSEKLHELGIAHDTGLALTGIKGYIRGGTRLWSSLPGRHDAWGGGRPQSPGGPGRTGGEHRPDGRAGRGIH